MAAIGLQLSEIKRLVRSHAKLSNNAGMNTSIDQMMVDTINTIQDTLWLGYDWSAKWTKHSKALAATQRYYDFPTTLRHDFVTKVQVRWADNSYRDVFFGIDGSEYNSVDSEASGDNTRDYVQKWDYYVDPASKTPQFEVWPVPVSNDQTLYFWGMTKLTTLVADSDRSELNGTLIALFAAASILGKDGKTKLGEANTYLSMLRKRNNSAGGAVMGQMGGGPKHIGDERKVRILVARSP